jgi:hypothetical protein
MVPARHSGEHDRVVMRHSPLAGGLRLDDGSKRHTWTHWNSPALGYVDDTVRSSRVR